MKRLSIFLFLVVMASNLAISSEWDFQMGVQYYDAGDYANAAKHFRLAADAGDAHAQFNLGSMYKTGQGVYQSDYEAAKWFRKAAEQGYSMSQHNLGCCYKDGIGVSQNYYEAVKWFRKAAEQGYL